MVARSLATGCSETERHLADESSGPRGSVLPMPLDAGIADDEEDDNAPSPYEAVQAALAGLKGQVLVTETTQGGHGLGPESKPSADYKAMRIGAAHHTASVELANAARSSVLAACGIPPALSHRGEGAGLREAYRQFLFGTVEPIGRQIAAEATAKLDVAVALDFAGLQAADVQGRSRAYASLVNAGMPSKAAARIAGVADG